MGEIEITGFEGPLKPAGFIMVIGGLKEQELRKEGGASSRSATRDIG